MNWYKLDDKIMDTAFLKGDVVVCRAVLHPDEQTKGKIKEGDDIVVMLSTGPKYRGKVIQFSFIPVKGYAMGEIEIVRV